MAHRFAHSALKTADMLVFTVVESLSAKDFDTVLGAILEWSELLSQGEIPLEARIPHQSIVSGPTR